MSVAAGAQFGAYRIKRLIHNQGGYVSVFEAASADGMPVLLRVLNQQLDLASPEYKRFVAEFTSLSELCHPGILPVLDVGAIAGKAYYAAPLSTFKSLADHLTEGRVELEWRDAVEIGKQVLEALEHMHAARILHRDLRTTSVYYDLGSGRAVIAEFNLVRNFNLPSLTLQGVQRVALPLITPEIVRELELTPLTDLYLVGNLVYEIVAGKSGISLDFKYRPLRPQIPEVPEALDRILEKALQEEPRKRFQSCAEFRGALAALG